WILSLCVPKNRWSERIQALLSHLCKTCILIGISPLDNCQASLWADTALPLYQISPYPSLVVFSQTLHPVCRGGGKSTYQTTGKLPYRSTGKSTYRTTGKSPWHLHLNPFFNKLDCIFRRGNCVIVLCKNRTRLAVPSHLRLTLQERIPLVFYSQLL
ncbi:hypothetical protein LCGC14_2665830, partial [marine sediment metagenome]